MRIKGLTLFVVLVALYACATAARPQPSEASNDIIVLSQSWWGVQVADFPHVAGLNPGEFTQIDDADPNQPNVTAIIPKGGVSNGWMPKELQIFSISFEGKSGLQAIRGTTSGTESEVRGALEARYGQPELVAAMGQRTYIWTFKRAKLIVSGSFGSFSIEPIP